MKAVAGEELMRNTKYKRLKNTPQSWPLKKKKKKVLFERISSPNLSAGYICAGFTLTKEDLGLLTFKKERRKTPDYGTNLLCEPGHKNKLCQYNTDEAYHIKSLSLTSRRVHSL